MNNVCIWRTKFLFQNSTSYEQYESVEFLTALAKFRHSAKFLCLTCKIMSRKINNCFFLGILEIYTFTFILMTKYLTIKRRENFMIQLFTRPTGRLFLRSLRSVTSACDPAGCLHWRPRMFHMKGNWTPLRAYDKTKSTSRAVANLSKLVEGGRGCRTKISEWQRFLSESFRLRSSGKPKPRGNLFKIQMRNQDKSTFVMGKGII